MANKVRLILKRDGAGLSSNITSKLMNEFKLTNAAARQQVSRGFAGMKKLAYLNFPKRVKFIYLEEDYNSDAYWNSLESVLREENTSCYSLAYWAIKARAGIVKEAHFTSICGSPLKQKKHVAAEAVLNNLILAKILIRKEIAGLGSCLVLGSLVRQSETFNYQQTVAQVLSRYSIEDRVILPAMKDWLRRSSLVSFNKVEIRDNFKSPTVSTFQWDLTAPSYMKVLTNWNDSKKLVNPGFVTCDVLLRDGEINEYEIKPFLKKCETLSNLKTTTRFFHIIIAHRYSAEALKILKGSGLVLASTTENFFGKKVADGLQLLTNSLTESHSSIVTKETYLNLINIFDQFHGVYGNLKGTLFEMFCSQVIRERHRPNSLKTNLLLTTANGNAEIDIFADIDGYNYKIIECKGLQPNSTIEHKSIEEWVSNRIPRTMTWIKERNDIPSDASLTFELWITCKLSKESDDLIQKVATKVPKYNLTVKNIDDIKSEVKATRNKELKKTFKTVFQRDPLRKVKQKISETKDELPF